MTSTKLPILGQASDAREPNGELDPTRELPDLHEAILDWEAVDCVLADIDDFVDVVEIQERAASGAVSTSPGIVAARDRLVAGEVHGLQIIYRFADQLWIDTLLREPTGARLLRMLHNPTLGT